MDDINLYELGMLFAVIVIVYLLLAVPLVAHLLINGERTSAAPSTNYTLRRKDDHGR